MRGTGGLVHKPTLNYLYLQLDYPIRHLDRWSFSKTTMRRLSSHANTISLFTVGLSNTPRRTVILQLKYSITKQKLRWRHGSLCAFTCVAAGVVIFFVLSVLDNERREKLKHAGKVSIFCTSSLTPFKQIHVSRFLKFKGRRICMQVIFVNACLWISVHNGKCCIMYK
jgi:hypothetical protein